MRRSRFQLHGGFTLLELLVAVVILSTLTVAVSGVLTSTLRTRDRTGERLDDTLRRATVVRTIQRDLSQMLQPNGVFAASILGEREEAGEYAADRIEFYAASALPNAASPWGDVQRVSYYLTDQPEEIDDIEAVRRLEGWDTRDDSEVQALPAAEQPEPTTSPRLVREVTRNLLPSIEEEPVATTLLEGVRGLLVEYYDGEVWQDSWDSSALDDEAPIGVRIRIDFDRMDDSGVAAMPIEIACEIPVKKEDAESAESATEEGAS